MDRAIHRLHAAYVSLPFTLLLPPLLLAVIYVNDFFGHMLALTGLSIMLIVEARPPLIRLLCIVFLPLVAIGYTLGADGFIVMACWLVICFVRIIF